MPAGDRRLRLRVDDENVVGCGGRDCRTALGVGEGRYKAPLFAATTVGLQSQVLTLPPTPGSGWVGEVQDRLVSPDDQVFLSRRRSYLLPALQARR